MRLPNTAHTSRPWRIHELTRDFRLEDVWALPTPGGPDDFPRLVQQMASGDPSQGSSRAVRTLFAIRWKVGELLGWDDPDTGLGSRVPTLRDRLPADLRDAPSGPDFDALPFTSLYLLDDEWAAEIANRTMHGVHAHRLGPGRDRRLPRPDGRLGEAERTARDRLHGRDQAVPAPDRVPARCCDRSGGSGGRATASEPAPAHTQGVNDALSPSIDGRAWRRDHVARISLLPPWLSADLSVLRGQRVLITGAARGIGAALAERLASHGARLALVGLEPETMAAVAERCGEGTFVAECDVSSNEQVTQAIDAAAEALGGLDVVVANAGIAAGGPLRSQDLRSWERVIEINLLGVMYTDRAALPHLERSGGYVLNIASTAAVLRGPGLSAYCAAKAGVEALSDCLRVEMEPLGVKVGVAYFLFLDTDMVRDGERESPMMRRAKAEVPPPRSRVPIRCPRRSTRCVAAIAQRAPAGCLPPLVS